MMLYIFYFFIFQSYIKSKDFLFFSLSFSSQCDAARVVDLSYRIG